MKRRYQYLHPFSHKRGAACLVPGTSTVVQAFPTKIFFFSLEDLKNPVKEIDLNEFSSSKVTIQQDLESLCVRVFSEKFSFYINQALELCKKRPKTDRRFERLCFGITKKQEMEKIYERADLKEIFPIWFRLGQLIHLPPLEEKMGIFSLVENCEKKINFSTKEEILPAFLNLFSASFCHVFLPRTKDDEWQNLFSSQSVKSSALHLFSEGWRLIRQLFFIENEKLEFLPHLPSKLPCGRLYDLKWSGGRLHLEWSNHKIRRVILFVEEPKEILLTLPKGFNSFLLQFENRKKQQHFVKEPLIFEEKGMYILHKFQK